MYTVFCAQRKITGEWTTWLPYIFGGRVHQKRPKDTEETWIPTEEQREQAKAGLKPCFWALIGTNRGRIGFFGSSGGTSGFGLQIGTVPARSGRLASMRTSTGFASSRFSRWQSENQKDSRLGRVRIIISDGSCTLQIKMVSREACVCAMCSMSKGQGLHVCMRAYLCNLLGSAVSCWPNPAACCGHCISSLFFWSLFVNLLCRKPEIESLGFTCNWLVLVGRLAWTSASCTNFRVADKFTTAKRKAETLYRILWDTQLSFGCCVGLVQLKETPAHRTAASLWLRTNSRRCTSEPTPH